MIEISVPSSAHLISKEDFSFDTTDFDMLNLPKPISRGGTENDVVLTFQNDNEIKKYCEELTLHKIIKPSSEADFLKNKKIERLLKSIELHFQLTETKNFVKSKSFIETSSGVIYSFIAENTLSTSTGVKTHYSVNLRNDKIFLDTKPTLLSNSLEININTDGTIELSEEFTGDIKLILQEEQ